VLYSAAYALAVGLGAESRCPKAVLEGGLVGTRGDRSGSSSSRVLDDEPLALERRGCSGRAEKVPHFSAIVATDGRWSPVVIACLADHQKEALRHRQPKAVDRQHLLHITSSRLPHRCRSCGLCYDAMSFLTLPPVESELAGGPLLLHFSRRRNALPAVIRWLSGPVGVEDSMVTG